jgi:hypothetical protein
MKLNKEQIKALVNKISVEIKEQVNLKNEKIINLKENKKKIEKIIAIYKPALNLIEQGLIQQCSILYKSKLYSIHNEKDFIKYIENKEIDLVKEPFLYEIENSIILNTIECDNLDQLIERIKNEYIN